MDRASMIHLRRGGHRLRGATQWREERQVEVVACAQEPTCSSVSCAEVGDHGGEREARVGWKGRLGVPLAGGGVAHCQGGKRHPLGVREREGK